ncbi:putative protein K02A2.6-like protein [Labeo rohita]|uniref:Uncharacterized protein n=1 Tax=Labeo rohita TaxID=84645 RepID=A0A498MP82_LABRO|nr:putative protein K02A2.6-like protein [Labeo rohita]
MLMSWRLRSPFDLLLPDVKTKILKKQQKQNEGHDKSCKLRSFEVGDSVYVRNYSGGPKWIPAVVKSCTGPLSYKTALGQGQTMKRYVDQIRTRSTDEMFETVRLTEKEQDGGTTALSTADVVDAHAGKEMSVLEKAQSQEVIAVEKPVIAGGTQPTNPRRSAREKSSPARFRLCCLEQGPPAPVPLGVTGQGSIRRRSRRSWACTGC